MCAEAYAFSKATTASQHSDSSDILREYDEVYRARHYIGRLSSWRKAARNVVSFGRCFPDVLANYEVAIIPRLKTGASTRWTLEDDVDALLGRVIPNYRGQAIFLQVCKKLKDASRSMALTLENRRLRPKPHAEVVVLDHFFTQGLDFVMGDNYVACSKPSCYCCKMFFDFHPLRAATGRYHGNVWIQWGLPRPLKPANSLSDGVTMKILRLMSDRVRRDVLSELLPRNSRQVNMFDSTTGFSASRLNFATEDSYDFDAIS